MYKHKFNLEGMSTEYDKTRAGANAMFSRSLLKGCIVFGKSTKWKNDQRSRKYDLWKKICRRNLECLDWRRSGWRG